MAVSLILAEKEGRTKHFTPAAWELMPEGKYGWVAVSGPAHIAKGKSAPTPPEAVTVLPEKVSIEKKSVKVDEKDNGVPPDGSPAKSTENPQSKKSGRPKK